MQPAQGGWSVRALLPDAVAVVARASGPLTKLICFPAARELNVPADAELLQIDRSAYRKAACQHPLPRKSGASLPYPAFPGHRSYFTPHKLRWRILVLNAIAERIFPVHRVD
ncbi:hypothetical protein D3C80_1611030 [compost metagenome]